MTDPDLPLDGPHWDFALKLYGRPGVAQACLVLQDEAGVDVIVLMMALFAASRGAAIGSASDVAAMDAEVAGWRSDVVHPLRAVRRRMKDMQSGGAAAEALRSRIKADELQAEKIELAMLAKRLPAAGPAGASDAPATVAAVVAYFARANGRNAGSSVVAAAMQTVAQGAA